MANYETLKSSIQQVVRANGNQEITGDILQQVLLAMVNSLGDGYQFAGIATPSTNPGVPDQRVFYIAVEPGVYRNFGTGIPVVSSVVVIRYDSVWSAIDTGIPNNKGVQDVTTLIVNATDEEDIIETDLDVDAIESAVEAGKRVVLKYGAQELGFVSIGRRGPTTKVAIFANMFDATGENPYLQTFIVQDYECTVYTDSLTKMSLIGVLSHLRTVYKTDLVGAINEVTQKVIELSSNIAEIDANIDSTTTQEEDEAIIIADDNDNIITEMHTEDANDDEESQSWSSDDYDGQGKGELYAKITPKGILAKGYYDLNGNRIGGKIPFYVLDASGNGDFQTIQDVLDNVPANSTIFVKCGEYSQTKNGSSVRILFNKGLKWIGEDKYKVIFSHYYGAYGSTAVCNSGTFCNITFLAGYNSEITPTRPSSIGYSLHIDFMEKEVGVRFGCEFNNCRFISYWNTCVGCGQRKDYLMEFQNCIFDYRGASNPLMDTEERSDYKYCCFACHNVANTDDLELIGIGFVDIKNCILKSNSKTCLMLHNHVSIDKPTNWTLIGNSLYSSINGKNCIYSTHEENWLSAWDSYGMTLNNLSNGNNVELLNK